MTDQLQARVQRIEADVHALYRMSSIRDRDKIRTLIMETFGEDSRTCIVFRGIQLGLNGPQIARALHDRGFKKATKQRVSETLRTLDDAGFVTRTEKGHYVAADGLRGFGLDKTINATLRRQGVADLP